MVWNTTQLTPSLPQLTLCVLKILKLTFRMKPFQKHDSGLELLPWIVNNNQKKKKKKDIKL